MRIFQRLWNDSFIKPNDTIAIIGEKERAVPAAIQASMRAKKIYLFLDPPSKSSGEPIERTARKIASIAWMAHEGIVGVRGLKEKAVVEFALKGSKMVQDVTWVVFVTDWIPTSTLVQNLVRCDSSGAIVTSGSTGATSTPGLFACGEVTSRTPLPAIAAAANGLGTSLSVCQFLLDVGIPPTRPKPEVQEPSPVPPPEEAPPPS